MHASDGIPRRRWPRGDTPFLRLLNTVFFYCEEISFKKKIVLKKSSLSLKKVSLKKVYLKKVFSKKKY